MGRFGDWAKGHWRDTVRVKVYYEDPAGVRRDIITTIPRSSLDYRRDAVDRILGDLKRAGRSGVKILSTELEGEVPFIWEGYQ